MKNKVKIIMGIVIALVFLAAVAAILFKKFAAELYAADDGRTV